MQAETVLVIFNPFKTPLSEVCNPSNISKQAHTINTGIPTSKILLSDVKIAKICAGNINKITEQNAINITEDTIPTPEYILICGKSFAPLK